MALSFHDQDALHASLGTELRRAQSQGCMVLRRGGHDEQSQDLVSELVPRSRSTTACQQSHEQVRHCCIISNPHPDAMVEVDLDEGRQCDGCAEKKARHTKTYENQCEK